MTLSEFVHRFIPIDEAVWDISKSLLGFGAKKTAEKVTGAADDQSKQRRDWLAFFFSNYLTDQHRETMHAALRPEEEDPFERAMGKLFAEARDGIFSQTTEEIIEKIERPSKDKGKPPEKVEKTTKRCVDIKGFERQRIVKEYFRNACSSPKQARIFIDMLLQKSAGEKIAKEAKKRSKQGCIVFLFYLAVLVFFAWTAVINLLAFAESENPLSTFAWGLLCLLITCILVYFPLKPLLPRG